MNPSYKKEKDNDYMILEAPGKPEGSEYQIRMLLVNKISGLLDCKMRKIDGILEFYYDITECQPMPRAFERQLMGKQDIEKLLRGLEKAMDEAGRYLLNLEQFVLKPDYIFRNVDTGEFAFCYLPFYDGSLEEDFRELAEYILKRLDHSQEEAVLWGYDIYSRSVEEHFSMGKILESVHERTGRELAGKNRREEEETEEPEYQEYEEQEFVEKRNVNESQGLTAEKEVRRNKTLPEGRESQKGSEQEIPKQKKPEKGVSKRTKQVWTILLGMTASFAVAAWAVWSQGLNFIQAGGILFLGMGILIYFTNVFQKRPKAREDRMEELVAQWEMPSEDEEDRTVFLGKALPEEFPVLVSMDPGKQENIVLDKPHMTVGKQKDQVDIFLTDPSVSRIHASIDREKNVWYLQDCHSTNGTYVDGKRLNEDEKTVLEDGMEIRFSERSFYFHRSSSE